MNKNKWVNETENCWCGESDMGFHDGEKSWLGQENNPHPLPLLKQLEKRKEG